jgi:hypothetical protein
MDGIMLDGVVLKLRSWPMLESVLQSPGTEMLTMLTVVCCVRCDVEEVNKGSSGYEDCRLRCIRLYEEDRRTMWRKR